MTEKIFSESQLRAIAQALGDTSDGLSNSEIDEIFSFCRIQDEVGPNTKWKRIFYNLWNYQVRDKNRRRSLAFIRHAMKPERYLKDPDRFTVMLDLLNKALSFSGLEMDEAGSLSSTTQVTTLKEAEQRAKLLRSDLEARNVHPDVLIFCKAEFLEDNYFHAVLEAVKSVFEKIRMISSLSLDGAPLIDSALGGEQPILKINPLQTESERSEQKGFVNLIKGANSMFRNPTAHEPRIKWQMSKEDAVDLLSIVSLIHRRLDKAKN